MTGGHGRVLIVRVGEELLALPLEAVREVVDQPLVQPLPLAPRALRGHLQLRDQHLSALDAGTLLGVRAAAAEGAGVALVFADGFALLVDDAEDVWERDRAAVLPVPSGTDRLGVLEALLRHGATMAALVDAAALSARALATLREHASL